MRRACVLLSTAPDRLHDLHAIAVPQFMLRMATAWHDFAIHFDGDTAFTVACFGEQRGDRRGGRAVVCLTIEENLHVQSLTPRIL